MVWKLILKGSKKLVGLRIVWNGCIPDRKLPLMLHAKNLPDFASENACLDKQEFLSTSVVAIGWERTYKGWVDASFKTDSRDVNHLFGLFLLFNLYLY